MSLANITNIVFESEIAPFLSTIKLNVTFEALQPLPEELKWKVIYIGSPSNDTCDQILDEFSMDQIQRGVMQFTIETNPPNLQLIPSKDDLLGVTALLISVCYRKQEFFRVGYYVYNNYITPELIEKDPPQVMIDQVYRQIAVKDPRITRFQIDWIGDQLQQPEQSEQLSNQNFMFTQQTLPENTQINSLFQ